MRVVAEKVWVQVTREELKNLVKDKVGSEFSLVDIRAEKAGHTIKNATLELKILREVPDQD